MICHDCKKERVCKGNKKIILSLDGGGIRGVFQVCLLIKIQQETNRCLCTMFDMIVGTSIGGIIGIFLAQYDHSSVSKTLEDMINYDTLCTIMNKSLLDKVFENLQADPIYDGIGKTKILNEFFKIKKFGDVGIPCAVTTYNLKTCSPRVFCSWKPEDDHYDPVLLGNATSSAPTYFPMTKIDNEWYADGGVAANNPASIAYTLGKDYFGADTDICIVSLGTGTYDGCWDHDDLAGWGGPQWLMHGLIDMVMNAPGQMVSQNMTDLLDDHWLRLDSDLIGSIKTDDISRKNIAKMEAAACKVYEDNKDAIKAFLEKCE